MEEAGGKRWSDHGPSTEGCRVWIRWKEFKNRMRNRDSKRRCQDTQSRWGLIQLVDKCRHLGPSPGDSDTTGLNCGPSILILTDTTGDKYACVLSYKNA